MSEVSTLEALRFVQTRALGSLSSRMLAAAFELKVFDRIGDGTLSISEAADDWGMPEPSARVLAQFLCNMGLLYYEDGRLRNSVEMKAFMTICPEVRDGTVRMCRRNIPLDELYEKLRDPPAQRWYKIQNGEMAADEKLSFYRSRMHRKRICWGEQLATQYDFSQHRHLLDIAGATGGWCVGIRRRYPELQCTVFDMPAACEAASELTDEHPEVRELTYTQGDLFDGDLPSGSDIALLSHVLHDWSEDDCRIILSKTREAIDDGGVLLVKEYYHADDWTNPVGEAARQAFGVLGAGNQSGWQPSYSEMQTLLEAEGFKIDSQLPDLIVARKAG